MGTIDLRNVDYFWTLSHEPGNLSIDVAVFFACVFIFEQGTDITGLPGKNGTKFLGRPNQV